MSNGTFTPETETFTPEVAPEETTATPAPRRGTGPKNSLPSNN